MVDLYNMYDISDDYKFISDASKKIDKKLISDAITSIDRGVYKIKLNEYLYNVFDSKIDYSMDISDSLENGIFEFSLVHITTNNLMNKFIKPVYENKFNEIISNIDEKSHLFNINLKTSILNKQINPNIIAFMSPDQLMPEKWADILKKRNFRIETEKNIATSDTRTCFKCGEKKFRVTQFQTRCADEPVTTFFTCVVCYNTFTS